MSGALLCTRIKYRAVGVRDAAGGPPERDTTFRRATGPIKICCSLY